MMLDRMPLILHCTVSDCPDVLCTDTDGRSRVDVSSAGGMISH